MSDTRFQELEAADSGAFNFANLPFSASHSDSINFNLLKDYANFISNTILAANLVQWTRDDDFVVPLNDKTVLLNEINTLEKKKATHFFNYVILASKTTPVKPGFKPYPIDYDTFSGVLLQIILYPDNAIIFTDLAWSPTCSFFGVLINEKEGPLSDPFNYYHTDADKQVADIETLSHLIESATSRKAIASTSRQTKTAFFEGDESTGMSSTTKALVALGISAIALGGLWAFFRKDK